MLVLKKAGYVDSKRGIGGGFFLKRAAEELTVGEVIRQVDGPIDPTTSLKTATQPVRDEEQQALEEVWMNVTHAISDVIDRVTFADLMCRAKELREKNSDFNYII